MMKARKYLNVSMAILVTSCCHGMDNLAKQLHDLDACDRRLMPVEGTEHIAAAGFPHGHNDYSTSSLPNNLWEACFNLDGNPSEPFPSEYSNTMNVINIGSTSGIDPFNYNFFSNVDPEPITSQSLHPHKALLLESFKVNAKTYHPALALSEEEVPTISNHFATTMRPKKKKNSNESQEQTNSEPEKGRDTVSERKKLIGDRLGSNDPTNWHRHFSEEEKKEIEGLISTNEHSGIIFPTFLTYVEMINDLVPQNSEVMNRRTNLKNASALFWALARSLNENLDSIEDPLLKEKSSAIRNRLLRRGRQDRAYVLRMASLWNFLEFWMKFERPGLMSQISNSSDGIKPIKPAVKAFFSTCFAVLSREDLTAHLST